MSEDHPTPIDWDIDEGSAWGAALQAQAQAAERVDALLADGWARLDPRDVKAAGEMVALHQTLRATTTNGTQLLTEPWVPAWWLELWRACPNAHGEAWFKQMLRCAQADEEHRAALLTTVRMADPNEVPRTFDVMVTGNKLNGPILSLKTLQRGHAQWDQMCVVHSNGGVRAEPKPQSAYQLKAQQVPPAKPKPPPPPPRCAVCRLSYVAFDPDEATALGIPAKACRCIVEAFVARMREEGWTPIWPDALAMLNKAKVRIRSMPWAYRADPPRPSTVEFKRYAPAWAQVVVEAPLAGAMKAVLLRRAQEDPELGAAAIATSNLSGPEAVVALLLRGYALPSDAEGMSGSRE